MITQSNPHSRPKDASLLLIVMHYDAAQLLNETTLRSESPELWKRYLNSRVITANLYSAKVRFDLNRKDLVVVLESFQDWLDGHPQEDTRRSLAHWAIHQLTQAIDGRVSPCH